MITLTWIRTDSLAAFAPITQVYGVCFDAEGNILISRSSKNAQWQINGGHPENDEAINDTLTREMLEEVDVKVKNIRLLGVQKVDYPNNPDTKTGNIFYQVRCVCDVDETLQQSIDPGDNIVWERMFVPANRITDCVKWGEVGNAMFKDAIELHKHREK